METSQILEISTNNITQSITSDQTILIDRPTETVTFSAPITANKDIVIRCQSLASVLGLVLKPCNFSAI